MIERFSPESRRGKIAQMVEIHAGKEFGPEGLKKDEIARCLNIETNDLSNDEWIEISEFAVNAGAELIQTAIKTDLLDVLLLSDVKSIRNIHKRLEKNKDRLIPYHDIFHAAETYRLNKGSGASARFIEVSSRERYTDPEAIKDELYPLLFFAHPSMEAPLPVLLYSLKGREILADFFKDAILLESARKEIQTVLFAENPLNHEGRQKQYEALIEAVIIGLAQDRLGDMTAEEVNAMRKDFKDAIKNPQTHYANFAARVFNEEWRDNPRLFLDELLECILTKPEPKTV